MLQDYLMLIPFSLSGGEVVLLPFLQKLLAQKKFMRGRKVFVVHVEMSSRKTMKILKIPPGRSVLRELEEEAQHIWICAICLPKIASFS